MSYYNNPDNQGYPPPQQPPAAGGYYNTNYGGGDAYYQPPPPPASYQQAPPPGNTYYPPPQQQPPPPKQYQQSSYDPGNGGGDTFGNGADYEGFKGAERYNKTPKFRDLWAALLFLAQFALFVVLAALFIRSIPSDAFKHSGNLQYTKNFYSWPTMIMWLCVLLVSIVVSLVYLILVQAFARQFLIVSFWFSVVVMIGTGIYYLAARIWFAGAITLIFGVFYALMWFSWRKRIPFSRLVLETVCYISRRFPSIIAISVVFLIIQTAYGALWSLTFAGSFKYMDKYKNCSNHVDRNGRQYQSCSNPKQIATWVFMVFSFYWTSSVIMNVLHATICGAFATYYFFEGAPGGYPTNHITLSSLKRALTNSFGSICFGSLIVAVIQTLRALLRSVMHDNDNNIILQLLAACAQCILGCIEGMVEFFNKYAYVEIAMFGKPFTQAAKDTWVLVKDRGVDALINDCLIGNVLQLGAFLCGAIVAIVAWLYITITKPQYNVNGSYTAPIIISAFVIAMSIFMVLLRCIDSGAATTFVCLAEDPQVMARNNPRLFSLIQETYPQVVRGVRTNNQY